MKVAVPQEVLDKLFGRVKKQAIKKHPMIDSGDSEQIMEIPDLRITSATFKYPGIIVICIVRWP